MMGLLHSARTLDFFFFLCVVWCGGGEGILKTWNTCMKIIPYHYLYSLLGIYISIWCITKSSQIWGFSHHELEEAFSLRIYLFSLSFYLQKFFDHLCCQDLRKMYLSISSENLGGYGGGWDRSRILILRICLIKLSGRQDIRPTYS